MRCTPARYLRRRSLGISERLDFHCSLPNTANVAFQQRRANKLEKFTGASSFAHNGEFRDGLGNPRFP
jgi:hypothetical protein